MSGEKYYKTTSIVLTIDLESKQYYKACKMDLRRVQRFGERFSSVSGCCWTVKERRRKCIFDVNSWLGHWNLVLVFSFLLFLPCFSGCCCCCWSVFWRQPPRRGRTKHRNPLWRALIKCVSNWWHSFLTSQHSHFGKTFDVSQPVCLLILYDCWWDCSNHTNTQRAHSNDPSGKRQMCTRVSPLA